MWGILISTLLAVLAGGYRADPEQLFRQYANMVYKIALLQLGSRNDADDVFGEVFLRLVKYAHTLKSEEHAKAWLIRVTGSCCKKHLGSAWHRRTTELPEGVEPAHSDEGAALSRELRDMIAALPEQYRTPIYLYYYEGYSVGEIAGLMDRREGTIKSWLHRGRERLRELWEEE